MADPKAAEASAAAPVAAPAGGGSNKIVMGLLGLNTVVMVGVLVVLFLGQKKQAAVQTLDQVAQGAASEAHGGGEEHAAASGGGEHGGGGGEHGGAKGEAPKGDVRFFNVGDFTANLGGPASTYYVKVSVNFELSKDADDEEMKNRKPQFRDKIISLLNSKKPSELQTLDGRNYLKDEIRTVVNGIMQKGKVEGVYFSTFIVN